MAHIAVLVLTSVALGARRNETKRNETTRNRIGPCWVEQKLFSASAYPCPDVSGLVPDRVVSCRALSFVIFCHKGHDVT